MPELPTDPTRAAPPTASVTPLLPGMTGMADNTFAVPSLFKRCLLTSWTIMLPEGSSNSEPRLVQSAEAPAASVTVPPIRVVTLPSGVTRRREAVSASSTLPSRSVAMPRMLLKLAATPLPSALTRLLLPATTTATPCCQRNIRLPAPSLK